MKPGDTVSRYRILGKLGTGGMGVVYRAEDTRLHRPVALKFLPPESLGEADRQRFLNEARAAAAVQHPNICPIYDVDEADGQIFIAMACVEGKTLADRVAEGPMDIVAAARIGAQVAAGLEAAHRQGIVHRDIKGGNILVDDDGHASILDFGLALRSAATRLTDVGSAIGTPAYMSPEQAMGKAVDFRTDIWSLGVLLFEMVTGVRPFRREHHAAVSYAIVHDPTPPVAGLRPATPPEMRRLIETALNKEPGDRWQSAQAMVEELRKIAGDSGSSVAVGGDTTRTMVAGEFTAPGAAPKPAWRAKPGLAWLALAAIVLASGVAYKFYPGNARGGPASSVTALTAERQVAVLPFQMTGGDPKVAAVADGMAELLTGALSNELLFHGKVTAVPASEIRARQINTAAEARRIYGVNLVVSGSARPASGQSGASQGGVEFTLNLIDTSSADAQRIRQISAKTVVWDPEHPAESKSLLVDQLSRMLNFELTPLEKKAVTAGDSGAAGAYQAYLEGRGLLARFDVPGNTDKSITAFQKAIAADPNYALAYAGLGEGYWRKLREDKNRLNGDLAVTNAEKAVQLDGSLAITHTILGQVYGTLGRRQEAIAHLKKALEIAPNNAEAPRQLASLLAEMGKVKEAEASYIQATKARPTDWYGYSLLAVFYMQQERYADAEKAFFAAQTLTPDNDLIYRNLAGLFILQGHYGEAEKRLQKALSLRTHPSTYAMMASARFFGHRYEEATAAMETAIELNASDPSFWGNLGIYYSWTTGSQGKAPAAFQKAIEMTQKALEVMPDDDRAKANLAEYKARTGDARGALAQLGKLSPQGLKTRATSVVLVYELTGHRADAIRVVREEVSAATLHQIRDDPDLARLWADAALQKALASRPKNK